MAHPKSLTAKISVAPQIYPEEVALLARDYRCIVNNRPDHEEPGQPASADIEAEATRLGLEYHHIPVSPGKLTSDTIDEFSKAAENSEGPVLAFCKSGTRSTILWALSEASHRDTDEILKIAATAGYDLTSLRPALEHIPLR